MTSQSWRTRNGSPSETLFQSAPGFRLHAGILSAYNEKIVTQKIKVEILRRQQYIYVKGNSESHWTKRLAAGRDIDLNRIYPKYLDIVEKNPLIIPVMRNVSHNNNMYAELILCNLIQCVEGYMRKMHIKDKYDKNIVKNVKLIIHKLQ